MQNVVPKDFILGGIYRMNVGSRSHNKEHYFVRVIGILEDGIVTEIPINGHWLRITKDNNWKYQTERMLFVGNNESSQKLVYNQQNILN